MLPYITESEAAIFFRRMDFIAPGIRLIITSFIDKLQVHHCCVSSLVVEGSGENFPNPGGENFTIGR
jgi:hypothetical protein